MPRPNTKTPKDKAMNEMDRLHVVKYPDEEDNHQKCFHCGAYTDECMCSGGRD